jgi:hypothetical protein
MTKTHGEPSQLVLSPQDKIIDVNRRRQIMMLLKLPCIYQRYPIALWYKRIDDYRRNESRAPHVPN